MLNSYLISNLKKIMRKPIIAGNWKMNMTVVDAVEFVNGIKDDLDKIDGVDVAFCPTAIVIPALAEALSGTKIGVGAQNMYFEESGAFTGELAASMLSPYCQYVILGHSERREYFGESDAGVNKKAKVALAHGMIPIICCGESLAQNEAGETVSFVGGQIRAALDGIATVDVARLVIAYEPIWAIGTGRVAQPADIDQIIGTAIRGVVAEMFGQETAEQVRIQYGGSVKPENCSVIMALENVDGALVGGASLKPSFVELVQNAV
ncbi:MAG: triosephosphate isomerase [Candidatus Promineifilaceae bacterium]